MLKYEVTNKEITKTAEKIFNKLKTSIRYNFFTDKNKIISQKGIYVVWKKNTYQPVYIGETRDLKARYKDMHNTLNHTLRRKTGKRKYKLTATSKQKFSNEIENELNEYFKNYLELSYIQITFGRVELQDELICIVNKYIKKKGFEEMYNSNLKRGKINLGVKIGIKKNYKVIL